MGAGPFGFLVGEIIRRVTGATVSALLRAEVAGRVEVAGPLR